MNTLTTNNIAAQPAYLTELRNLRGGRLTKVNGITTSLAPLATAVILTFATAGAMAQYSVGTGNPTTVGALAISANAAANAAGTNSIAIGENAAATGDESIAIGTNSMTTDAKAIAIGLESAAGTGSVALGTAAKAESEQAVAIGNSANAQGINATAIGSGANALEVKSTALGYGAYATAEYAVALGAEAAASASNSVALGSGSQAGANSATAYLVNAKNTSGGAVSVGASGSERQITNVAPGLNDTDAVNVEQLKAVSSAGLTTSSATGGTVTNGGTFVNATIANGAGVYNAATAYGESAVAGADFATAFGSGSRASSVASVAIGVATSAEGEFSIAIGSAIAQDSGSIAIGHNALVELEYGVAIGDGAVAQKNTVSLGRNAESVLEGSVAIGYGTLAGYADSVALGSNSVTSAKGAAGTEFLTADALVKATNSTTLGAVSVGSATANRQIQNVAAGTLNDDAANVAQVKAAASSAMTTSSATGATFGQTGFVNATIANGAGVFNAATAYGESAVVGGQYGSAFGTKANAIGAGSTAVGSATNALGRNDTVVGTGAGSNAANAGGTVYAENTYIGAYTGLSSTSNNATAIGYQAGQFGNGSDNVAVGRNAGRTVNGSDNIALGQDSLNGTTGNSNVAIGRAANKNATVTSIGSSIAIGDTTVAQSENIAIGTLAKALFVGIGGPVAGAVAIGRESEAGGGGVALGRLSKGTGYLSAALGYEAHATAAQTTAIGYSSTASAANAIAIGNADATAADSIAVGRSATASGVSTIAMGHNSTASGGNAVALGAGSFAKGNSDTVIGSNAGADNAGGITYRENTYIGTASGQGGTSTGATAVGFYSGRNVSGLHNTAIGDYSASTVTGNYNIGVGYEAGNNNGNATTASHANVGIGYRSGKDVTGNHSVSMGSLSGSNNVGSFNVSIGTESNYDAANAGAYGNVVAVGYQSSARFNNATALGYSALAGATNSIAIGDATTNATDAVAMGRGAIANNASDVALGKGSTSAAVANTTTATVMGANTATFAGSAAASTLSVGAVGTERTLTNVAAGRVTATSTDGINGSQLFGVANVIDTKMDTQGAVIASALGGGSTYTAGTNVLTAPTFTHVNANNITGGGASSTSVGGAVAVLDAALGSLNAINNDQNTAISQLATSNATNSLAYDYLRNSVTVDGYRLGDDPSAMPIGGNERGTTALGAGSQAHHGEFNTAVGSNAIAIGRSQQTGIGNNTAIGAQASTFDIQNGGFEIGGATAVGSNAKAWAENSTAIGFGSDVRNIDVISTQPLIGGTAIGQGAIVEHSNAISIGTFSTSAVNTDEAFLVKRLNPGFGALSIGGVDPGTGEIVTRQIKNVAPGLERTDAVNVEQLSVVYDQANSAAQQASYAQQGLQGVANAIGGGASYNYAGTFTAPNFRPNLNNATTLSGLTGVPASAAVSTVANAFGRVDAALGAINTTNLAQTAAISQLASGTGATTPFTLNAPTGGTTIQLSTASAAVTTLNLANGANPITVTGVKDGAATNDAVNFGQLSAVKTTADNTQTFLVGAGTYAAPAAGSFVAQTNTVNSAVNNATTGLAATNLIANTAATAAANANTSLSTVATVLGTTIDPLTGAMTNPSYSVTNTAGTTSSVNNLGDAISTLEAVNNAQSTALTSLSSGTSANTPFVVSGTTIGLSTSGMPATSLNLAGTAGDITVTGVKAGVANNDAVNFAQLSAVKTTADTTAATVNNATTGLAATKAIADAATAAATNANTGLGSVATALGGGAMYNAATGALTPPSYSVTNTAGTTSSVNNLGDAISTLNTVNNDQSTALTNLGNGTSGVFVVDSATGNAVLNSTLVGAAKAVDMGNRTVTGVNNGVANSDAVNFGQLTAAANTAKSFSTSLGATTAAALGGATAYDAVNNTMAASFTLANAGAVGTNNGAPFTTVDAALQALDTVNATQDTKLGDLQQNVTNLGNGSTGVMVKDAATGNAVLNSTLIAPTAAVDMGNRTVTGVKAGAAGLDAVNFTQLSATNSGVNSLAMALGGNYNSSTGAIAGLPTSYTVNGQTHSSITGALTAVSSTVSSLAAAAGPTINGGAASTPFTTNGSTITVAASGSTATTVNFANANTTNAGGTMTLTGVAAGVNATDAVNVSQLAALKGDVNQAIATATGSTTGQAVFTQASAAGEVKVNAGINASAVNMGNLAVTGVKNASLTATSTEAVNGSQLNETNQALDTYKTSNDARLADLGSSVGTLSGTVAENAKKAAAGTAMAIATVHAVNAAPAPGKVQVGVGLGTQDGQTALAFGINGTSASGRYGFSGSVSAGTSINKPKVGAGVGVRFVFD